MENLNNRPLSPGLARMLSGEHRQWDGAQSWREVWIASRVHENILIAVGRDPGAITRLQYWRQGSSFRSLVAALPADPDIPDKTGQKPIVLGAAFLAVLQSDFVWRRRHG